MPAGSGPSATPASLHACCCAVQPGTPQVRRLRDDPASSSAETGSPGAGAAATCGEPPLKATAVRSAMNLPPVPASVSDTVRLTVAVR